MWVKGSKRNLLLTVETLIITSLNPYLNEYLTFFVLVMVVYSIHNSCIVKCHNLEFLELKFLENFTHGYRINTISHPPLSCSRFSHVSRTSSQIQSSSTLLLLSQWNKSTLTLKPEPILPLINWTWSQWIPEQKNWPVWTCPSLRVLKSDQYPP